MLFRFQLTDQTLTSMLRGRFPRRVISRTALLPDSLTQIDPASERAMPLIPLNRAMFD
jgi:hypothetical protein